MNGDFNPRSREGSDPIRKILVVRAVDFNPRSREGSDNSLSDNSFPSKISIHAPAKGATSWHGQYQAASHDFNPRSREGSDYQGDIDNAKLTKFQSTLPRRERHTVPCQTISFHPISIHAPAKGATFINKASCVRSLIISIHAPAKGATRYSFTAVTGNYFNPRSREGSD